MSSLLIFDLDGTLIDSRLDLIHAVNATRAQAGRGPLPQEQIFSFVGNGAPILIQRAMGPGALDPLTKEMIYVAVSVTNQCGYCIASHTVSAQKKGMTDAMFKELMAVVGMANETNKMVTGYQVEIDERFKGGR